MPRPSNGQQALHNKLLSLGIANGVYYQPPEKGRMTYPCFLYDLSGIRQEFSDNSNYTFFDKYSLTLISTEVMDGVIRKILDAFPMIRFERHYRSEHLHHYTFELFF